MVIVFINHHYRRMFSKYRPDYLDCIEPSETLSSLIITRSCTVSRIIFCTQHDVVVTMSEEGILLYDTCHHQIDAYALIK